jgi:hypothetical protein
MVHAFDKISRKYARCLWCGEFCKDELICEGSIEMNEKIMSKIVDSVHLIEDNVQCPSPVKMVLNFGIYKK